MISPLNLKKVIYQFSSTKTSISLLRNRCQEYIKKRHYFKRIPLLFDFTAPLLYNYRMNELNFNLQNQAYNQITGKILRNEYRPGQKISQKISKLICN